MRINAIYSRGVETRDYVPRPRQHQIKRSERPRIASVQRHVGECRDEVPLRAQFVDHRARCRGVKDEPTGPPPAQQSRQVGGVGERLHAGGRYVQRGPCVCAWIDEQPRFDAQALQCPSERSGKDFPAAEALLQDDLDGGIEHVLASSQLGRI